MTNSLAKDAVVEKLEDTHLSQAESTDEQPDFQFTFGKFLACLSFHLGYLSDIFGLTAVSAVLSVINNDIGPSPAYTWIAASQSVGITCLSPIVGRFGDIFGRRKLLLVGNIVATVGCAVAATAKSINVCIAGGTLMGLGAALHQICWASLGEVVPKKARAYAMGFMELGMIPASIFGAPIAFAFVENGSWRPIFWLSAGFNVVSFFGVLFFYHPLNQHIREDGKSVWDQLKETDLVGPGLFTAGTTLFLLGLSFGGHMYPWLSAQTLAPLLIGAALLVAVGLYSAYTTHKYACFPSHIFKNVRGFTVVLVGIFLYGMSLSSTPILWPQQVRLLYTQDSRAIGWYAMAMGIGGSWGGLVAGWIVKRYGSYHIVFPTVLALLTLFSGCQAIIHEDSQVASTALVILMGAVIAAAAVLAAAILQLGSHHAYIGIVSGMGTSARNAGGAVAQVVYVSILNQELTKLLAKNVAAPLARDGVPAADIPGIMQALLSHKPANPLLANLPPPLISKLNSGIKDSYIGSFRVVYLSTIAFGVVATLVACFTANLNDESTHHVDVALEEGAHIHTHDASEGHILEKDEMGRTFIR